MNKTFSLAIILILAVSSLITIKPALSQTIPKPSVPEFTIKTISLPYDVPPTTTTTIDPFTGKQTITTQPGYHVENKTTQIKIKNQPFNGTIYYNIRFKGHFSQDWGYYRLYNGSSDGNLVQDNNAEYTIVPIDSYLPTEGQIDFQIQALEGYSHGYESVPGAPGEQWIITGSASDWSNIQTLSLPDGSISISTSPAPAPTLTPAPTPTPTLTPKQTPTPTVPEFSWAAILPLPALFLGCAIILSHRKIRKLQ